MNLKRTILEAITAIAAWTLVCVLLIWPAIDKAFADEMPEPEPADQQLAKVEQWCAGEAMHTAWGAYARALGAPLEFKSADMETVRTLFFAKTEQLVGHLDGIYIADSLTFEQLADYQSAAEAGWRDANKMIEANPDNAKQLQDYEWLAALYFRECVAQVSADVKRRQ